MIDSVTHNGKQLTGAASIANCFAQSFASALTFCVPKPLVCRVIPTTIRFKLTQIEEEVVLKKLLSLDVNKATGPDKISTKLLLMVAPSIFRSLALIFNYSISSGCFPNEWKEANVSAVPKSRDSNDVKNYCPISVILVVGKVFESLVHQQLYSYLGENHLLRENQSGFRPNRSTQDVLLKTVDDWNLALDDNKDCSISVDRSQ